MTTIQYARYIVMPDAIERAGFDLVEYIESKLRHQLGDQPTLLTRWDAELFDRDEYDRPVRAPWWPGEPIPARTHVLQCTVYTG